jgi:hypothetical protein
MFEWNPTDVLAILEAIPEVEEYEISFTYNVTRDGLRLHLVIRPYDRTVIVELYREGFIRPAFAARILDCPGCRAVNDARGEYLEFAPARCFGNRYDGESPIPYGFRVAVNPSISVTLY